MEAHVAARLSVSASRNVHGRGCPSSVHEAGLNGKQVRRTAGSQLEVGSWQWAVGSRTSANCKLATDGSAQACAAPATV